MEEINAQASFLMKEGIRLMDDARPEAIAAALGYFDRALELRRGLPIETSPMLRYDLAACWLNRADAMTRPGIRKRSNWRFAHTMKQSLCFATCRCTKTHDFQSWPLHTRIVVWRYNASDISANATAIADLQKRSKSSSMPHGSATGCICWRQCG